MCLILFGYQAATDVTLVVAANRDEVHARPADVADFWEDTPNVLAGRDREAGGTWLGCTRDGRFAALTNFTRPDEPPGERSRGSLVQDFLAGDDTAAHYAHHIHGHDYSGFNLLLFDGQQLVYTSNRGTTEVLAPGFYGLSNAELGAPWPKCVNGAEALQGLGAEGFQPDAMISLLRDDSVPPDDALPHRGKPIDLERRLAPCFILGDEYGTRASTAVVMTRSEIRFQEQSYGPDGRERGRARFEFPLQAKGK